MKRRLLFPIRLKILITLLLVVTGVVSAITFTMANLFHDDKKGYIHDLASIVSTSTAEEGRAVLAGYEERIRMYSRILLAREMTPDQKTELLQDLFQGFPQLVAITLHDGQDELAGIFNGTALDSGGLSKEDLRADLAAHDVSARRDAVHVRNSTLKEALPSMTLTMAVVPESGADQVVATAVVKLEELLSIAARSSRGFETFLADGDAILLAHPNADLVARRTRVQLEPQVEAVYGEFSSALTLEYTRDDTEMIGGFAAVDFGKVVAGAQLPRSAAYLASRNLLSRLLLVALGLLALAATAGFLWSRLITRPVEHLSSATRKIGKGEFEIEVAVESRDEIGALANSFNQMARELRDRDDALEQSQAALLQSEKMAAFGQLGAGIAHEVKNPLAGILGCTQLSLRKLDKDNIVHKNLQLIEKETRRCKTIIENLLKFARQEKAILEPTDVNTVVQDAVAIVRHQLEMNRVELQADLSAESVQVKGNANQLQQVLINFLINAQQAMEGEPGSVTVITRPLGDEVEVKVRDTGPGMTEEVRAKLFEPFFTTKPGGKGTGLGLSVSFGIIQDHGGTITVESTPGQGATFIIRLPFLPPLRQPDALPVPPEVATGPAGVHVT